MSPIAAMNVLAVITLTPGTVISRRTSRDLSASRAIARSSAVTLASRKSTCRRHPATVSRSSSGNSSSASQRRPRTPNTSLTGGRPLSRRINTEWISFLARVRARTSWLRRASRRRIARVHSSGIQTASSSPAASSLASARASKRSVFARARLMPVSCGLTITTLATCGARIRAISAALPVTSNATRSVATRLAANNSNAAGVVSI